MNRARVSLALLSVLLWHTAAPFFVTLFATPLARGDVIEAAGEEGASAWVPSATGATELVNAIRGNHQRLCLAHRGNTLLERTSPREATRSIVRPHRSPYPARRQLHLHLSRSENGELPH